MTKQIFALTLAFFFAKQTIAQDDAYQSTWMAKPMTTDGASDDWQKPFNLYDGSTGLQFSIANDSAKLYLCFTANDENKARKMMRTGWQVELSSKEKNRKVSAAIVFPVRQMADFENKDRVARPFDWKKKSNFEALVSSYKMQFLNITASGFKTKNGLLPIMDSTGLQVNIGSDSLLGVVYELAIPLRALFDEKWIQLNEQLNMNVTVHGMESGAGSSSNQRSSSNWGNTDGRMAGDDMGGQNSINGQMGGIQNGGRMGGQLPRTDFGDENEGRGADRGAMYESASFKQKFKLKGSASR